MARGGGANVRFRKALARWLKRHTIHLAAATALLSLVMIPLSLWVFPSTTKFLTIIVLLNGFLSSVTGVGSLILDIDDADTDDSSEHA